MKRKEHHDRSRIGDLLQADRRDEFRLTTYSDYRKSAVLRQLKEAIVVSDADTACVMMAELVAAGQFVDAWQLLIATAATHVHISSPLVFVHMHVRLSAFRREVHESLGPHPLIVLREDAGIRDMFAELAYVVCAAPKALTSLSGLLVTIPESDLHEHMITARLKAPHADFTTHTFVTHADAEELAVACNELAYSLGARDGAFASYWVQWIHLRTQLGDRDGKRLTAAERKLGIDHFETGMRTETVWIVWDILLDALAQHTPGAYHQLRPVMLALLHLYAFKLTRAMLPKKIELIFMAIQLVTVPFASFYPFPPIIPSASQHAIVLEHSDDVYNDMIAKYIDSC